MNSEKYCLGCGVKLQDENVLGEGYTTSLEKDYCQRCFRIKNYGEYQVVTKSNDEYLEILKGVGETKDLVLYIADLLNIEEDINKIRDIIPNKMILVLNKRDVLPKSVNDDKLIEYFKDNNIFDKVIVISSEKNYNIDYLLKQIKLYQTTNNVYVVGHTNAGKSTLINKLLKNYSTSDRELTISPLPSTTLNTVEIEINEYLTLIDTPGLVDSGSIINYISDEDFKRISPKKEIKPKTFQLRKGQSVIVDNFFRIDYVEGERNSFTFYMSNDLKIRRISSKHDNLKDLQKRTYEMGYDEDICINGLGFVKGVNKGIVDIYLPDFKYYDNNLSRKYSSCSNYFECASSCIKEMYRQVGRPKFDDKGMMKSGVIVRHLILPGSLDDSKRVIKYLYDNYRDNIFISIMNQYTPLRYLEFEALNRKLNDDEYDEIINYAYDLGVRKAFIQEGETQSESFIPDFSEFNGCS